MHFVYHETIFNLYNKICCLSSTGLLWLNENMAFPSEKYFYIRISNNHFLDHKISCICTFSHIFRMELLCVWVIFHLKFREVLWIAHSIVWFVQRLNVTNWKKVLSFHDVECIWWVICSCNLAQPYDLAIFSKLLAQSIWIYQNLFGGVLIS